MVIRTPYGLTEIKACENNAFHFWMALIFWYNRPMWWHFSRHFIHLVAWLFYICPDCRSAKSHPYSFLSLDDLNSFFTEKIEAMRGNLHVLAPPELSLSLHLCTLSLPFSSPGDELSCSNVSPAPLPFSAPLIPSCSFQSSPPTMPLLSLIPKHIKSSHVCESTSCDYFLFPFRQDSLKELLAFAVTKSLHVFLWSHFFRKVLVAVFQ